MYPGIIDAFEEYRPVYSNIIMKYLIPSYHLTMLFA